MLSFKSFLTVNFTSTHLLEQGANLALNPLQSVLGSSKKVEILHNEDGKFACHIQETSKHTCLTRISLVVFALLGACIGIPLKALSILLYHNQKEIQFLKNVLEKAPSIYQAHVKGMQPLEIYSHDGAFLEEALRAYQVLQKSMVLQRTAILDPFFTETRSLQLLDETQDGNHDLNTALLKYIHWFSKLEKLDTDIYFTRDLRPADDEQYDYNTKANNFKKIHKKEVEKLQRLNPLVSFTLSDHRVRWPARKAFLTNCIPAYIGHCQRKPSRAL
jgi:hypothetical protein